MIAPARVAAYHILRSVSAGRSDLPAAIAAAHSALADERDRALASEIATGVQRWRAALDHLIVSYSRRDLARLDPEIVEILRLSVYQLLYLSRVPASAAVDDAVKLAKRAGKRSAAGLVNAVLRSISRQRRSLPLPPRPADPDSRSAALEYLSVSLSHPRWLAIRWYERLGFEVAECWMLFNNSAARLTLRANRLRVTREELMTTLAAVGVATSPGRFAPDALLVEQGAPLRNPDGLQDTFVVQDEASQLVALLAGAAPGLHLLDTCASPGGKTTAIAAEISSSGRVVACDVRDRRVELLRRTVRASGAGNVWLVQADLLDRLPFTRPFDCVLVDAPCSGLGTLRRDPDIRWRRHEDDLPRFAASQIQMLRNAAEAVEPGGRLVYATCSSEPEENEGVTAEFLRSSTEFHRIDARDAHPLLPATLVDARGYFRTLPDAHQLEAFFGAVFVRKPS